jgi:hypothetical protein
MVVSNLPAEQHVYARWLSASTRIALAALVAAFASYASGLLQPLVPLARLPDLWRLPAREFIATTGAPTGWGWVALLGTGDYLNLLGVALLATVTLVCYARLILLYRRNGDRVMARLAMAQVIVLLAAASGLGAGH